jgi:hypothetical protein
MMQETSLMMNNEVSPFLLCSQIFNSIWMPQTTLIEDREFGSSKTIT